MCVTITFLSQKGSIKFIILSGLFEKENMKYYECLNKRVSCMVQ